jgi:hypothetical protein
MGPFIHPRVGHMSAQSKIFCMDQSMGVPGHDVVLIKRAGLFLEFVWTKVWDVRKKMLAGPSGPNPGVCTSARMYALKYRDVTPF